MSADTRTDPPTPDPLTREEEAQLRQQHQPRVLVASTHDPKPVWCGWCGSFDSPWPCGPAQLIASLDLARAAALPSAPDQRLREALDKADALSRAVLEYRSGHTIEGLAAEYHRVRAALSESATSPEATLDVIDAATVEDVVTAVRHAAALASAAGVYITEQQLLDIAARLRGPA